MALNELKLHAELIGFHCVPGCHDGEHLAHAFLYVLDHVSIALKVMFLSSYNIFLSDNVIRLAGLSWTMLPTMKHLWNASCMSLMHMEYLLIVLKTAFSMGIL